jgi:hypothetical protein
VASDSRHDHASGTLTLRPSARSAVIESSVTQIAVIRASAFRTVLIPCLSDSCFVLQYKGPDAVQFPRREPVVAREYDRRQPELAFHPLTVGMDVHGFVAVEAVKVQPMGPGTPLVVGLHPLYPVAHATR